MEKLVQYIAESLVEEPDRVRAYRKETRRMTIIKLRAAPADTGRIIGKNGRVANAIRSLLTVAARHENKDVILEID